MQRDAGERSILNRPSETAMAAAFLRALAFHDEREEVRGPDYLAELFLPEDRRRILGDPKAREWVVRNRTTPGMYEFMIARTAFFDRVVRGMFLADIPQVVFLGAGYDTRPYRFEAIARHTRIFELDARPTQDHKREILRKAGIRVPDNVVFAPVDFQRDSLKESLVQASFDRARKTLFIWEGVTYYLSSEAIDSTLSFVGSNSSTANSVCFDYAALSHEGAQVEANGTRARMRSRYPGEPTRFGIAKDDLASFLSHRGYCIIEHVTPEEMKRRFLTLRDGNLAGILPPHLCFVHASVAHPGK